MVTIHNPRIHTDEDKGVVGFKKAEKRLILNKTQALAIAGIAQSERFADWTSTRIALKPGRAHNGKPTIIVLPAVPPPAASFASPTEEKQEADDSSACGCHSHCARQLLNV